MSLTGIVIPWWPVRRAGRGGWVEGSLDGWIDGWIDGWPIGDQ